MACEGERRLWWISLISLPVLITASLAANAWRNIEEYARRSERNFVEDAQNLVYAGASWRLESARLFGDGKDKNIKLPGEMRLVVVRLDVEAESNIGDGWSQCQVSLGDREGRRWLPLDLSLSRNISRELDPTQLPADNCGIASLNPPAKGQSALIEEKFVVPAEAVASLSVRISFASTRPWALSIPLKLD